MACPFFLPLARVDAEEWIHAPRLTLIDEYRGACRVGDVFEPEQSAQRDVCNCGYASGRCDRFPEVSRCRTIFGSWRRRTGAADSLRVRNGSPAFPARCGGTRSGDCRSDSERPDSSVCRELPAAAVTISSRRVEEKTFRRRANLPAPRPNAEHAAECSGIHLRVRPPVHPRP